MRDWHAHLVAAALSAVVAMGVPWARIACWSSVMRPGASEGGLHRLVELRDVIRLAAGDQGAIRDHGLVQPNGAGVGQITSQRRPGGQLVVLDPAGIDQCPGTVADGGDRLAGDDEGAHKCDGPRVEPQPVGNSVALIPIFLEYFTNAFWKRVSTLIFTPLYLRSLFIKAIWRCPSSKR